jgi:hypothetical protein
MNTFIFCRIKHCDITCPSAFWGMCVTESRMSVKCFNNPEDLLHVHAVILTLQCCS